MADKSLLRVMFPAEIEMKVLIINDETEQHGTVTIGLGAGSMSDPAAIRDRIRQFRDDEMPKAAPGFRLATNQEFWDELCREKFGAPIAVAGLTIDPDIE